MYNQQAEQFINALKTLCNNEKALDTFQCYLSQHFFGWLKAYAKTPEDIISEIEAFSQIQ